MTRRHLGVWIVLGGCYQPPDLPAFEDVPLVGRPFVPCRPDLEEQRVACVIDGDTADLGACGAQAGERIRLLGVDAPETEKPDQPAECFADEAHHALADLVEGEHVSLTFDRSCTDVYGRTLAYVWLRGGRLAELERDPDLRPYWWTWPGDVDEPALLLNEVLLGLGLARDYPEELAGRLVLQERLDRARDSAVATGRGLWSVCP